MINHLKTSFSYALRNTNTYQSISATTHKAASIYNRYAVPLVNLSQKKIEFVKTTTKEVKEHKVLTKEIDANIYKAISKDQKPIQELSALIANDILIQCFPDHGLDTRFSGLFNKTDKKLPDVLLEQIKSFARTDGSKYGQRQIDLTKISSFVEKFLLESLTLDNHDLFKKPFLIKHLSSYEGDPIYDLQKIGVEKGSIPEEFSLIITYQNGSLTAALRAKSELVNTSKITVSVPHIAKIGDPALKHFKEQKTNSVYLKCCLGQCISIYEQLLKKLGL